MKTAQILEKLISINTVDDKENQKMNKYLASFLTPLGFKIQLVKNKTSGKTNLLAKYNSKKPVITFSGHTDTVPPSENWSTDPFKLISKGDKLFGLGTTDMKGPIASVLSAVSEIDLKKAKKGMNLVFTYGEEVGLDGIQEFLKKVKLKTKYVILAEDSGLKPIVANKGAYAVKIKFIGKEAHGAEVDKGINAIILAQTFIQELNNYFEKIKKVKDDVFNIPYATINIAKIQGGDLINRVPASCALEFEYRTIKEEQGIKIYQDILDILRNMNCNFKICLDLQIPPMIIKQKDFITDMTELTGASPSGCNGTTEGSFFSQHGFDCMILGPGNDMAHQPNEFITKEQLNKGKKIYKQVIEKYCL